MGILNTTEDSFYDGGNYISESAVLKHVEQMLEEGATIIDLGAVSSKPNAKIVDEKTEFEAIKNYLNLILSHFPKAHISVDTFRATVAEMAIREGAAMINDISGGADPQMFNVVGIHQVPYVLTHNNRTNPIATKDLIPSMLSFFGNNIELIVSKGVKDIIIDPGFGFGKTIEHNYEILARLSDLKIFELPILVGLSRKSMIYKLLNTDARHALNGTTAVNTIALLGGANILRVHDVKEAVECVKIVSRLSDIRYQISDIRLSQIANHK